MRKVQPVLYYIAIFMLSLLFVFSSGDILPAEYSSIFDEHKYVEIATDLQSHMLQQDFTPYYNSRFLMPAVTYLLIDVLNLEHNLQNIRNVFLIFNFGSILISIFVYFKIIELKKYSTSITIIGFSFLFVNFFIMKFSSYYPVLMDIFGFTSGLLLYYFHIAKRKILFYISVMLSMFVFPTTILFVFALILASLFVFNKEGWKIEKHLKSYTLVILIPLILILIGFSGLMLFRDNFSHTSTQSSPILIPVTLILLFVFIYYCIQFTIPLFEDLNWNRKFYLQSGLYIPILIYLFYHFISKYLSLNFDGTNTLNVQGFIYNLFSQYISFPFKFLISHFIYFGLFVFFIIYFRKRFFAVVRKTDLFQKIILVIFLVLSFGTETRQFLQLFPFVVFLLLDSLTKIKWNRYFLIVVFIFQLIWSRFWYSINVQNGFLGDLFTDYSFLNYPAQRYFQFQGPWISTENSLIYGVILVIVSVLLYLTMKINNNPENL